MRSIENQPLRYRRRMVLKSLTSRLPPDGDSSRNARKKLITMSHTKMASTQRFTANSPFNLVGSSATSYGVTRAVNSRATRAEVPVLHVFGLGQQKQARIGNQILEVLDRCLHSWPPSPASPRLRCRTSAAPFDTSSALASCSLGAWRCNPFRHPQSTQHPPNHPERPARFCADEDSSRWPAGRTSPLRLALEDARHSAAAAWRSASLWLEMTTSHFWPHLHVSTCRMLKRLDRFIEATGLEVSIEPIFGKFAQYHFLSSSYTSVRTHAS